MENATNKVALYNFLSTFSGTHFIEPRTYQATADTSFDALFRLVFHHQHRDVVLLLGRFAELSTASTSFECSSVQPIPA